jgi:hypothetical protein
MEPKKPKRKHSRSKSKKKEKVLVSLENFKKLKGYRSRRKQEPHQSKRDDPAAPTTM